MARASRVTEKGFWRMTMFNMISLAVAVRSKEDDKAFEGKATGFADAIKEEQGASDDAIVREDMTKLGGDEREAGKCGK